jgi:hypothetical protein
LAALRFAENGLFCGRIEGGKQLTAHFWQRKMEGHSTHPLSPFV